jgi:hypothetical protein
LPLECPFTRAGGANAHRERRLEQACGGAHAKRRRHAHGVDAERALRQLRQRFVATGAREGEARGVDRFALDDGEGNARFERLAERRAHLDVAEGQRAGLLREQRQRRAQGPAPESGH